ncbi:MAG: KTSC domain-containing protein [Flavobacteriaceae bacterium]|nr:KTSC domain-containing protein [Flavobacteriaceae bacterium]
MKRIHEYKKMFDLEGSIELGTVKKKYRQMMKEWHPDKFHSDDLKQAEAEVQSQKIIEAYHFLVSMAPETLEKNLAAYNETITTFAIADYHHKGLLLEITFTDGTTYEYFGVNKSIFSKMMKANNLNRFAKRSIYPKYAYRQSKRASAVTV